MEPHFKKNDKKMFYKYLDKAKNYFEFGSGGSTYQASLRKNIINIFSVESDLTWINKLKTHDCKNVNYIFVDIETIVNTWGYPGNDCSLAKKINYSDQILLISDDIDLILIDGRFRVACCLKSLKKIKDNCYIVFDDFLNRPQYHIILDYCSIIEKTDDNCMVILKKNNDIVISEELIAKYEDIPN
jgi:sulfur transfer complex TusBCD TusB component (DsrH family)